VWGVRKEKVECCVVVCERGVWGREIRCVML
jgi:hypothetical protein